ncbi:MAG: FHA domain-containing protein [Microbacteriaceae bacterium]|nr:FHA domain-containing protein [Microbacteriaceae bacterium]
MPPRIPTYPVIHVNLAADGSAHVNVAGDHRDYPPGDPDTTRDQIIQYAVEVATRLGRGVRMTTVDPDGQWKLAVFPSGEVEPLEPAPTRGRGRSIPTVRVPVEEAAITLPRPVVTPPAPPARPRRAAARQPVAVLRFSTGDVARITDRAILGREPETAAGGAVDGWQQVEVIDTTKTMSRAHAELLWNQDRLLLRDLGSGNGTTVRRPAGDVDLDPAEAVEVRSGDTLLFGPEVSATLTIELQSSPR